MGNLVENGDNMLGTSLGGAQNFGQIWDKFWRKIILGPWANLGQNVWTKFGSNNKFEVNLG